jgi:hypothetical protein
MDEVEHELLDARSRRERLGRSLGKGGRHNQEKGPEVFHTPILTAIIVVYRPDVNRRSI